MREEPPLFGNGASTRRAEPSRWEKQRQKQADFAAWPIDDRFWNAVWQPDTDSDGPRRIRYCSCVYSLKPGWQRFDS
jgi:hypothetical protein